jgi:fascin 1/2
MRNKIDFQFRPKPPVKLPTSLIPSTVTHIKKPSVSQNGHHSKPIVNGNGHSHQTPANNSGIEKCSWSLGLINSKGKYLTAETFGCKINASEFFLLHLNLNLSLAGSCLKKKQKWTIIYNIPNDCVYLQSTLHHYLSTDKYGHLKCDTLEIDDDCRFQLEYNRNGQWAFKSQTYGMYFGGDVDQLHCFSKIPEWWSPHLALHPQVK